MLSAIDKRIRNAFSDASIQYDVLTSLHREIGKELCAKVTKLYDAETILDVGMGTGKVSKRLTFYFPDSLVVGMDFSSGMIDFVRKKQETFKLVQADAVHLPYKNESIDIAVSNLAYQWMNPLDVAFKEVYRTLKSEGKFCFTLFGEDTMNELFESLEFAFDGNKKFKRLPKSQDVQLYLQSAGFKNVEVHCERIKIHFASMMDLMKWLKDIGANAWEQNIFVGKQAFEKASEYYDAHYKEKFGINATFEVVWAECNKQ